MSGESGISFRNCFRNKGHQTIIIFYDSVKSAAVTATWYTVQRALLTLANHIRARSKDEGLVAGNLALKEFQSQTKSISVHIAWGTQVLMSILDCANLFWLCHIHRRTREESSNSSSPLNNLCEVCLRGVWLYQMLTLCQKVQVPLLAATVLHHVTSTHSNSKFGHNQLLPQKETHKTYFES